MSAHGRFRADASCSVPHQSYHYDMPLHCAQFKFSLIVIALLSCSIFLSVPASGQNGDDVSVGCYAGDQNVYDEIGNLDVFNPSQRAVGLCNAVYRDCYGRCWACWDDSDGYAVCKDVTGREFYR
jgi:hypothetical protein